MTLKAENKEERKDNYPSKGRRTRNACMLGAKGHGERVGLTLGLQHNV